MTKVLRLGEFAEVGAGNSAPQSKASFNGGTLPFVRTSDVGVIHIGSIETSRDLLTPEGAKGLRLFPIGTILFPKSGASTFLNHRVILNRPAYVSSHLATIKANSEFALDHYIHYFLQTVNARKLCQDQAYPSLNLDQIASIEVPLPSLEKQHEIVEKLNTAFAEIDSLVESVDLLNERAKELFHSLLSEFFPSPVVGTGSNIDLLNHVKETKWVTLGDVVSIEKRQGNFEFVYVGLEDIESDTGVHIGSREPRKVKSNTFAFTSQHLLYGRLRPYLNKVLVPNFDGHCSTEIFPIKVSKDILREYLAYWFRAPTTVKAIDRTATGARMPRANMAAVLKFEIPLPPIRDQAKIVEKLDTAFAEIELLKVQLNRERECAKALLDSLLSRAFHHEEAVA